METMNKCLPLVKQSQAEILLLLSDKIIDIDKSKNPNASTGKIVFNYLKNNCCDIMCFMFYISSKYLNGVTKIILN